MESFYLIVLTIAIIILIISLGTIGMLMDQGNKTGPFPPISLKCPDGWKETSTTSVTGDISYTCSSSTLGRNLLPGNGITVTNGSDNTLSYNDKSTTICQKHKFAQRNNLIWDGVSNYNSC
jgi:hypothetical protein